MHDLGTESHGHVLFRVTRVNTCGMCIETRFNLFQSVSSQTNTHYWYIVPLVSFCLARHTHYIVPLVSVCSPQHELKQIKLCFNARTGCEAALRSDGTLCLQSYYLHLVDTSVITLHVTVGVECILVWNLAIAIYKARQMELSCETYPFRHIPCTHFSLLCIMFYKSQILGERDVTIFIGISMYGVI